MGPQLILPQRTLTTTLSKGIGHTSRLQYSGATRDLRLGRRLAILKLLSCGVWWSRRVVGCPVPPGGVKSLLLF